MKFGLMVRKYQVWLSAAAAAISLELIVLLSTPSASLASGASATDGVVAAEPSLTGLGLPVGALLVLVMIFGARALRRARRQEHVTYTSSMPVPGQA